MKHAGDKTHTNDNPSHVVAVGSSAGGVDALTKSVSELPADTTAALVLVPHLAPAAPDHHVVVHKRELRLVAGPQESLHRPAIDPLFRSVARCWGVRGVGIVLTGAPDDGSDGLRAINEAGGLTLVQDPREAPVSAMPEHALRAVPDAEALPLTALAKRVAELRRIAVEPESPQHDPTLVTKTEISEGPFAADRAGRRR